MSNDRQPSPLGAGEATPWVIFGSVFFGATTIAAVSYSAAGALLVTGHGWHPARYGFGALRILVRHGPGGLYPQAPVTADVGSVLGLTAAAIVIGYLLIRFNRFKAHPEGLARPSHVRPLGHRAMARRATSLRPGLPRLVTPARIARTLVDPRSWWQLPVLVRTVLHPPIAAQDVGITLGDLDYPGARRRLFASFEDFTLAIMGPRTGKTSALAAPALIKAPGAAIATSNRADILVITMEERAKVGRVWTFDPQRIAHSKQDFWLDLLAAARTVPGAQRLAAAFVAATADPSSRRDFWYGAAGNVLTALFHAAACTNQPIQAVLGWLANPVDRAPVDALRSIGKVQLAEQLQGTVRGALETRDGIYETARQVVAALLDPDVARWITRDDKLERFDPIKFPTSRDTIYLLSKNGGGSAAGMIAAVADMLLQSGVAAAERMGGRLDPPMLPIFDEAANIVRLEDLPDMASYLGGTGLPAIVILQSFRQGAKAWGEMGMDALWGASTIKLIGAGIDDADFAGKLSRLIGDYPIWRRSVSFGGSSGHSNSVQAHDRPSLQASEIRTLGKGRALLLATGIPIAKIRLRPWYESDDAHRLSKQEKAAKAALRERAEAAYRKSLTEYDGLAGGASA